MEDTQYYELPPGCRLQYQPVAYLVLPADGALNVVDIAFAPDASLLVVAFKKKVHLYAHVRSSDIDFEETWSLRAIYTVQNEQATISCMDWLSNSLLVFGFDNGDITIVKASAEVRCKLATDLRLQPHNFFRKRCFEGIP